MGIMEMMEEIPDTRWRGWVGGCAQEAETDTVIVWDLPAFAEEPGPSRSASLVFEAMAGILRG